MQPLILFTKCEPTGKMYTSHAFVTRTDGSCGFEQIEVPEYTRSPDSERFRQRRIDLELGLRAAAKILGISAVDLSSIERGRCQFIDGACDEAIRLLELGAMWARDVRDG